MSLDQVASKSPPGHRQAGEEEPWLQSLACATENVRTPTVILKFHPSRLHPSPVDNPGEGGLAERERIQR